MSDIMFDDVVHVHACSGDGVLPSQLAHYAHHAHEQQLKALEHQLTSHTPGTSTHTQIQTQIRALETRIEAYLDRALDDAKAGDEEMDEVCWRCITRMS